MSYVENKAKSFAMGEIFSSNEDDDGHEIDIGTPEDYDFVQCHSEQDVLAEYTLWETFEHFSFEDMLVELDGLKRRIQMLLTEAMEDAKKGIIHETINCTLDGDMNALDMNHLAKIGEQE